MNDFGSWIDYCCKTNSSDLVMTPGVPPQVRRAGGFEPIPGAPVLTTDNTRQIAEIILPDSARANFSREGDWDGSFAVPKARFRVNVFLQRGSFAIAMRRISEKVPTVEQIGLPVPAQKFCEAMKGLVMVTGATGSGKSTTLAAMVNSIANSRPAHIITVEDPIEYNFKHSRSIVEQREVGRDSESFARALRSALRQRPDVLVVGEMRDTESISVALTMAETGHLVLATLHTNDTAQTIDRIVDVFPSEQQRQIKVQLAGALVGITSQMLLPKIDGSGVVAAFEVMVATPAIKALIREGKTHQIRGTMHSGAADGHLLMERSLAELVRSRAVLPEVAESMSLHPEDLRSFLGGENSGIDSRRNTAKLPWLQK